MTAFCPSPTRATQGAGKRTYETNERRDVLAMFRTIRLLVGHIFSACVLDCESLTARFWGLGGYGWDNPIIYTSPASKDLQHMATWCGLSKTWYSRVHTRSFLPTSWGEPIMTFCGDVLLIQGNLPFNGLPSPTMRCAIILVVIGFYKTPAWCVRFSNYHVSSHGNFHEQHLKFCLIICKFKTV